MRKFFLMASIGLLLFAQPAIVRPQGDARRAEPTPPTGLSASARLSDELKKVVDDLPKGMVVSRKRREQAYAKLLEGQRYLWMIRRTRSARLGVSAGARKAKKALKRAVELNPRMAEGYTALAELSLTAPPQDIDEAIRLSEIATRLDADNFGGYRFLGRLYTIKSNLGRGELNGEYAVRAIAAWKQISRLDPSNAEAWAFLSAFYGEGGETDERIEALKRWLAAAAPIERGFYSRMMRNGGELSPYSASLKLGRALLDAGREQEALGILARAVSEQPGSIEAVELLGQALENTEVESVTAVIEALRQAVFANPGSLSLNRLLARTLAAAGKIDDAAKVLRDAANKADGKDDRAAAEFIAVLGDIYAESGRTDAAIGAYRRALETSGIRDNRITDRTDRDFANRVLGKMLAVYEDAERYETAERLIADSNVLFGEGDVTLTRKLIDLKLRKGDRRAALDLVRSARRTAAADYSLLRSEASILTQLGRVEEAVALMRGLIVNKPAGALRSVMYDDFVNYLFISSLYNRAGNGEKAISAAKSAFVSADGVERKQIAKLTLASAQQASGDLKSAEKNLREILAASPTNPIALNNLGYLFLESGKNFEEARDLIRGAVRIDGRNPSYLDSLGWAYYRLGQLEKAEKYLRKALRFDATSSTILEHLGDVLNAAGNPTGAEKVWRKALRFAPHGEDSDRLNGKLEK